MTSLVFIIIFIFCLAIAGGCLLISYQFISSYNTDFHKTYFYYLVSFYAFALYAIWGHILIRTLMAGIGTRPEILEAVANFSSAMGIPFLFISWVMLINLSYAIFEKTVGRVWIIYHTGLFVLLMVGIWLGYNVISDNRLINGISVRYVQIAYLSIFGIINNLVFLTFIKRNSRKKAIRGINNITIFAMLVVGAFLLQACASIFAFHGEWQLGIVILLFFASNLLPTIYLKIHSDAIFLPVKAENSTEEMFEQLAKKYQITKRENQIVTQICLGKTNQQIADELFISLQTVKDHTHRIYSKIGINSRMQLVQLFNK